MPRRPVKPEDRQRVARACDPCKASKKRCDGTAPCDSCRKKGNGEACHYTPGRRRHPLPRRSSFSAHNSRLVVGHGHSHSHSHSHSNLNRNENGNGNPNSNSNANANALHEPMVSPMSSWDVHSHNVTSPGSAASDDIDAYGPDGSERSYDNDTQNSSSEGIDQPPLMLSSNNGENVFIGKTAAISFLRFLQKTLERHAGPSGFTNAKESHKLFEADSADVNPNSVYDSLSINDKKSFIQVFLDVSSGLLDLYSWQDISVLLGNHEPISPGMIPPTTPKLTSLETASLYLMIAIGAQCGHNMDDAAWAAKLFSYARKLALEGMLENPSLDLVRAFLLMAFYMFGACRRNSAFMYLGVASKAADILGLHSSAQHYKHLSQEALYARLRTAKSLRVFDIICNSILGRPSSTPSLLTTHTSYISNNPATTPETTYKALALGASYEISTILNDAVARSSSETLDTHATENFVLALRQRSRTFPPILRHQGNEPFHTRHMTIGNVHVAGTYYFSVILVTRHCLIRHVVPLLSGQQTGKEGERPGRRRKSSISMSENKKISELADACIEAATFMAQMCHQVLKSGALLGNMCILKAWTFATGLVLGFSLLIDDTNNQTSNFPQKRTAFLQSLHVLGALKRSSPQAEEYYHILLSFHQSIKTYREQLLREKQTSARETLVDRVFIPDHLPADFDDDDGANITTQLPSPDTTVLEASLADFGPLDLGNVADLAAVGEMPTMDQSFMGGDDVIMRMLWDVDRYAGEYLDPVLQEDCVGLDASVPVQM